jgi:hypothetical protein
MVRDRLNPIVFLLQGWCSLFTFGPLVFANDLDSLKAGVVKLTSKTGEVGTGFTFRRCTDHFSCNTFFISLKEVFLGGLGFS